VFYLITHARIYCWIAIGALALVATFGLTMAVRWIWVYRTLSVRASAPAAPAPYAARPGHSAVPACH